jgi:predicted membrane channel-forming protein YqfA (hemolysin III family)
MSPSPRKPFGVLLIIVLLVAYAVLVASLTPWLSSWPALAQAPVYLFLGVIWIAPLRPLLRWMETGKLRR